MKDYAVILFDGEMYDVGWFATLKEACEARQSFLDDPKNDWQIWIAYCPPALMSYGETLVPIKIPGVPT